MTDGIEEMTVAELRRRYPKGFARRVEWQTREAGLRAAYPEVFARFDADRVEPAQSMGQVSTPDEFRRALDQIGRQAG